MMKKAWKKRILALLLACMIAVPATAMADNEVTAPAEVVYEAAETEIAAEESMEVTESEVVEAEEETAAEEEILEPVEAPEDESSVDESAEEPSEEESTEAQPEIPDGLLEKDGKIYCYENNEMVTGLKTITVDGKEATYYFDKDGAAVTGYKRVTNDEGKYDYYYFQSDCKAYTGGFLEFVGSDDVTYYFFFGEDGKAYTEGYKAVKTLHKADAKGKISEISDGNTYKYYFRTNGRAYTNGFLEFVHTNGKTYQYYFQKDGKAFTGGYKKAKTRYAADAEGNLTKLTDGSYYIYYFQSSGVAYTNGVLNYTNTKGKTYVYYFQKDGSAYTQGYKAAKKIYKGDAEGNVKKVSTNKKYYYYFQTNGKAYTNGFLKFAHTDGETYYFYFGADGQAYTSVDLTISKRYAADAKGKITKISDGNKYGYSFNKKGQGSQIFGWGKIDGTWSWFNKSTGIREFASNEMYTAWSRIKDRSSGTSYYVVVDTTACRTFTFKGYANNWTPYLLWKCSPGKPSTPTVKGNFEIYGRGYSFGGQEYTCYYYSQFYGNYLFHSVLYNRGTFNIRDGRLGQQLSHGCVRLSIENAKWFYENLGYGTKVYIY